jgi:hypothetical protein
MNNPLSPERIKKLRHPGRLLFSLLAAVVLSGAAGLSRAGQEVAPADLVLLNGKIVTMEEARPEAEALAVRGDRVVAVGTSGEVTRYIGDRTAVIDLKGKLAVPGLIDSHLHFMSIGQARQTLDLTKTRSWDDIVAMVAEAAKTAAPGEWINGRGWHQEKWEIVPEPNVNGLPLHDRLSAVSPQNPVYLTHASGHSAIANAKAMELAGITSQTAAPDGGEVVKDARGNPIGVFIETAQNLLRRSYAHQVGRRTPAEAEAAARKTAELAARECLSKGLTSVHDAGVSFATIDLYKKLADEGRLGVRMNAMLSEGNAALAARAAQYRLVGYGRNHLTVRSIKRLIDGALGAHGAWLLEPYADLPSSVGLNTEPLDALRKTARFAVENDFQLCVHAIGDRGNRETLDIYEAAFKSRPDKKDLRWRIEHAQHLSAADIPRFGALGVIAAMQGVHCTSDGPWVFKRLGEARAAEGAYVWRKLMDSGAVISNGTDAPVEDVDPIPSLYASMTRRMKNGEVFFGAQRMTRLEALRSYTLNAAAAAFEEDLKGSLTPGKLADLTVFDRDIMTVPEDEILKAAVAYTIVGGRVLYEKK